MGRSKANLLWSVVAAVAIGFLVSGFILVNPNAAVLSPKRAAVETGSWRGEDAGTTDQMRTLKPVAVGAQQTVQALPNPTSWPESAVIDQSIRDALDAISAHAAVEQLARVASDPSANQHLTLIKAVCADSERTIALLGQPEAGTVDALMRDKLINFSNTYCGDVPTLTKKVAAIVARNPPGEMSKREQYIAALLAAPPSDTNAEALVKEILGSPDLRLSHFQALLLMHWTGENAPLASWRRHFRRYVKNETLASTFTLAAEMLNCPRLGGCGENQFHLAYECMRGWDCRPGEDLLAYRRRTTTPELYEAAERIAAEMQAIRSR